MNHLTEFIDYHVNWKEALSKDPYNLIIKDDPDYPGLYLFKYNQYLSDMSNIICQEARGIIVNVEENPSVIVCHSFDKFFNYCEENASESLNKFDWSDYSFQEKKDGSLLRMWYYNNKWNISTSGTIDAFKAPIDIPSNPYRSFGEMFQNIFDSYGEDTSTMLENFTYSFEMTSPDNKIVVNYEDNELTLIGVRNIQTNTELDPEEANPFENIRTPKRWKYGSINEALEEINNVSNFEGLVLCDWKFNRVKIKTDEYLTLAKLADATKSDRNIIRLILEDKIDDLQVTEQNIINRIDRAKDYINNEIRAINEYINSVDYSLDRKDIALSVKGNPYAHFVFNKLKNPDYNVSDYFIVDNLERIYKDYKFACNIIEEVD